MSDFNNLTEADHQTTKALWHEAKGTVRLQAIRIRSLEADKVDLVRVLGVADERIKALEAATAEAARMMVAIKRTWGPESHDDGADGELWAWLNAFVATHSQTETAAQRPGVT